MSERGKKTFTYYNEEPIAPIDDWTESNFSKLKEQLEYHLDEYLDDKDDVPSLSRLIFISLRQDLEDRSL